jgi:hypothetical protein
MPADEIMHKFAAGTLKSGSGAKVTNPAQAQAIAASYGSKGDTKKRVKLLPKKKAKK